MLSAIDLHKLFEKLGTPTKGRRLIEQARKDAPVRIVESRSNNVITDYKSIKMQRSILTESARVEYPVVIQCEFDKNVFEYYAQPCQLDIFRTDGGRIKKSRVQHYPDFLIIRHDQFLLEEWKTEQRFIKLAAKYPGRFVRETDGWHDPEIESYLSDLGITYRLRSADEHPLQFVRNLDFLSDYFRSSFPPVENGKLEEIQGVLSEKTYLSASELLFSVNDRIKARFSEEHAEYYAQKAIAFDDLYKAIADQHIFFDLYNEDISDTNNARIYRDRVTMLFQQKIESVPYHKQNDSRHFSLNLGASIEYDSEFYSIVLVGKASITIKNDAGSVELAIDVVEKLFHQDKIKIINAQTDDPYKESIESISPKRLETSLERMKLVELAEIDFKSFPKSRRTLQRYKKKIAEAGESVIDRHLALTPETDNRGKTRSIPKEQLDFIKVLVNDKYNTPEAINKTALYKLFVDGNEKDWVLCSQKTFNQEVNRLVSIRDRKGKRFAYQQTQIVWYLHHDEAIHGVRPFQFVHIDHTQIDLEFIGFTRNINLGKAWLSLASDASSRKVLGYYLTFDSPSYRSNMMVLRDIVRRHGRMPFMIITDNGSDFHAHEWSRVNGLFGCHPRYRPAGQPRCGSPLERLFGVTNTQFVHNLKGNTKLMKHVRMVTKSHQPDNFAEWTLPAFHAGLEFFFEKVHGEEQHPALGETPNDNFKRRMLETGERRNRLVKYDRLFLIETCPSPKGKSTREVDWERGIKVNHIWYSADEFRKEFMGGKSLYVRIDPWDASVVYALVKNKWIQCRSKLFSYKDRFTRVELQYGLNELAKKFRIKKKDLTPEHVATWVKLLDPKNFDPRLRERQSEALLIYEKLGMAKVPSNPASAVSNPTSQQSPVLIEAVSEDVKTTKEETRVIISSVRLRIEQFQLVVDSSNFVSVGVLRERLIQGRFLKKSQTQNL